MADLLPLIITRFHIPSLRSDEVPRPRLLAMLDRASRVPLALISTPPGFGKTILAADWAHAQPAGRVAWLSLAEAEYQPAAFWRYVLSSLQHARPGIGGTGLTMLGSSNPPPIETILASLINDLASSPESLLLILDDYHLIQHPEIHSALRFLLDNQPPNFHIVILTREDPPLGLARRRAHRQMVEIRAADLRFSLDEAESFLRDVMQLSLTPPQVAALENHTEGWVVGLQMAALSLQGRDPQEFFKSFTGDNRYIADYLIEEVLQAQSEPVRRFLLQTSILERLCTALCEALLGDQVKDLPAEGNSFLEYLDRANLFLVPLDQQRHWYRYHHLFSELLRQRLVSHFTPAEIADLHRRASRWFEANGDIPSAVQHAWQISDPARAMGLLTQYAGQFFIRSELLQLIELTRNLSEAQREDQPVLCMAVAWALLATNQDPRAWLDSIERHFGSRAQAVLEENRLEPDQRRALVEVLILQLQPALDALKPQSHSQLLAVQGLLKGYAPDQRCLFNTVGDLEPVVSFDLGLIAEQAGDLAFAETAFKETIQLARQTHNDYLLFLTLGHLANIQTVLGHLQAARQAHEQSLAERPAEREMAVNALAYAGLGALHYEWGDLIAAADYFEKGLPLARSWNYWEALVPLTMGKAQLLRRLGESQRAIQLLNELGEPLQVDLRLPLAARGALWKAQDGDAQSAVNWFESQSSWLSASLTSFMEPVLLDTARLLGHCGRPRQAIPILERIIAYAETQGHTYFTIQGKIVLAKMLQLESRSSEALVTLSEALQLAAPEAYLSSFIDEGEPILRLLEAARSRWHVGHPLEAYCQRLLAGYTPVASPLTASLAESRLAEGLSERERQVLQLIADGMTNAEISERLFISLSTVKTHAGNIYNKLGVTNRIQAISRAAELGLIPPHGPPN